MRCIMSYDYFGLELTPSIFEKLLIQFYDGKQFSRQDAVETITKYHKENGGVLGKTSYTSVFKKAAQKMSENGLENVGYGMWRLRYNNRSDVEIVQAPIPIKEEFSYVADKEIGEGKNAVYVYYYDCYKELALLKGENRWACKIGRTDVDPIGRIISQAGTCYPELPHVALVINCIDSALLEKAFHDILKLKKRWIKTAPGKEWFITSPQEIENLFDLINDDIT